MNFNKPLLLLVTPEVAAEMLENNNNNRPLNERTVSRYARVMKEGLWREDNEVPINIDKDGNITNGQHRLWAIVNSGVSLWFWVMRSTASHSELFATYDTGQGRSLGTLMKTAYSELSTSEKAALASMARQSYLYDVSRGASWSMFSTSPDELIVIGGAILESEIGRFALEQGALANKAFRKVMRWWATSVYLVARDSEHAERLQEFLEPLYANYGYWGPHDPRVAFYSLVSNSRAGVNTNKHARRMIATFIITWNKFVVHQDSQTSGYKDSQSYPTIK